MGVSSNDGDQPGLRDYKESTLEAATNKANAKRLHDLKRDGQDKQHYPKTLYKMLGETKTDLIVPDEAAHAIKKKAGWVEHHELTESEPTTVPTKVSEMTEKQAAKFIKDAAPADLGDIRADEQAHGARATVLKLIEDAMDAVPAAKPAKAKK